MSLDFFDKVASVVGASVALTGAAVALRRYARDRRERGWWSSMNPLWQAQQDDAIVHPYRFERGYVPPLSTVYVPRTVVPRSAPAGDRLDVETVVTGAGNALVIGEPGSGKTALVRQECARSARRWLDGRGRLRRTPPGPVVVSLPAAALVSRALPDALADAYQDLGPQLDFTRAPAPGRQWLVCVDGVDAVADPDDRAVVLNRLAGLGRASTPGSPTATKQPWRVLVTSRQLAEDELAVLGDGYPAYHLVLFADTDVARFADGWFRGRASAREFLDWTHLQRVTDPVRNPLTATIAALVWENELAGSTQPPGPEALLDAFVRALLRDGQDSLDATCDALLHAPPEGEEVAAWLLKQHTALVEAAAIAAVDGHDPVMAAVDWSAARAPHPPGLVLSNWPAHVRQILLTTGLFRADRHGLTSVWPSLVEYLAAGPLARDLSEDRWIAAMTTTSQRGVALHAFHRAPAAPAFLRDVAVDPARAVAAGHLLAAGGAVAPDTRADVLAALLAHWAAEPLTHAPSADPRSDRPAGAPSVGDVPRECFSLLMTLAATRADRDLLHEIGADPARPTDVRRAAALFFAARTRRRDPSS